LILRRPSQGTEPKKLAKAPVIKVCPNSAAHLARPSVMRLGTEETSIEIEDMFILGRGWLTVGEDCAWNDDDDAYGIDISSDTSRGDSVMTK
jgi:hypothetical protein